MKGASAAIALLTELLRQAAAISTVIKTAHDEGRDVTSAELDAFAQRDDAARQDLAQAIVDAKAAGR